MGFLRLMKLYITYKSVFTNLFFLFLVVLLLASCNQSRQKKENKTDELTIQRNTFKRIKESGVLKAVVDYNSTNYFVFRGKPMGFKYELLQQLAKDLEVELEIVVSNNLRETFDGLDNEQFDLVAKNLTVTKQRGEEIRVKTNALQELNKDLLKQKKAKQNLIEENRIAKNELAKELKQHEALMSSIKKDLNKYTSQIRTKQKEADKIDKEIEKIIRAAMASSNKKAGKSTSSTTFALTAEDKLLANNFTSNKGKLPWPVEKGVVKLRYGLQRSPIDKNIPINSNGVRIATNKSEKVRAVFNGTVLSIMTPKNGNNTVLIRHGNYITIYKNLSKIYVNKGDKINTKQNIGEVLTNRASGETILSFVIYKDGKTQNPAHWIYKM